jgi:hypothetical protein
VLLFGYVLTHRFPAAPSPPDAQRAAVDDFQPDPYPRISGRPGQAPAGLRLLVSGDHPGLLDVRAGRHTDLPGLAGVLPPNGWAWLRPAPGGVLATLGRFGALALRTVLLTPTGLAVPLGDTPAVTPLRDGGFLAASVDGRRTSMVVRTASGTSAARWTAAGAAAPVGDTVAGTLVRVAATEGQAGADLLLVDPRTGTVRRRLGTDRIPLGASATAVAHLAGKCFRNCQLAVTDVRTGRSREYPTPDQGPPRTARFSPDGRRLALFVPGQYVAGNLRLRPGFVAVLDLATGAVVRVPGVETGAEQTATGGWSADGTMLVLGVWSPNRGNLALWWPSRPEEPVLRPAAQPAGDYRAADLAVLP